MCPTAHTSWQCWLCCGTVTPASGEASRSVGGASRGTERCFRRRRRSRPSSLSIILSLLRTSPPPPPSDRRGALERVCGAPPCSPSRAERRDEQEPYLSWRWAPLLARSRGRNWRRKRAADGASAGPCRVASALQPLQPEAEQERREREECSQQAERAFQAIAELTSKVKLGYR